MALLSRELLRLFASGHLAGTEVQCLAHAAWQDGWGHNDPLARKLAKPGVNMETSRNIARDVVNAAKEYGLMCTQAEPYTVSLPAGKGSVWVMLPHEVYPAMVRQRGCAAWCLSPQDMEQPLGKLLQTWAGHPDVLYDGDLTKVGILGVHCDGVAYTSSLRAGGSKGILVASWNVVSSSSEAFRNQRQPLFILQKGRLCGRGCGGYHTLQKLFEVVAWSFQCLLAGVAPSCRHDGQPWSPEDRKVRMRAGTPIPHAALQQLRGDWEWLVQCFRLRSFNSELFCWMCNTTYSHGPLCFRDFRPTAAHRGTLISHQAYLDSCHREEEEPSTIFRCPGVTLDNLCVDSMHAGDLGAFQDAIGGLLWLEVTHKAWHRNSRTGLIRLNEILKNYYDANADQNYSRACPLVMSQLRATKPGYPVLKSKAAQCRHLAQFCVVLAHRHRNGTSSRPPFRFPARSRMVGKDQEHLDHLVDMCEGLANYHSSCADAPFDQDLCRRAMYRFLQALGSLNRLWRDGATVEDAKQMPFNLRQKSHVLQHLVEEKTLLFGSPARSWCYRDEDFIGAVKRIAQKTSHPHTLEKRCMEKLMILTGLSVNV